MGAHMGSIWVPYRLLAGYDPFQKANNHRQMGSFTWGPVYVTLLQLAVASRIYKLCAKQTSNSVLRLFFYALPNNERSTKYSGLTYSVK